MPRKNSRRMTNYSNQNDEQQMSGQQQYQQQYNNWQQPQAQRSQQPQQQNTDGSESKANDNDSLIADMAQGFIQAQTAMTDKAMNFNNREIGLLLQKVNDQLEDLKRSTPNPTKTGGQSREDSTTQNSRQQNGVNATAQNNSQQQATSGAPAELQTLLASVLQGKKSNEENTSKSSNPQGNDTNQLKKDGSRPPNMTAVQTVSQVLAQAQYELANELENSLKKLKQVISESEKLANDMSNLLGEETMKNS